MRPANKALVPKCGYWGISGMLETTQHIVAVCEAFGNERLAILHEIAPKPPFTFSMDQTLRFLREINIQWLPTED